MGATLETRSVEATNWKQARDIIIDISNEYYGSDPYSGSFNTIIDWNECKKSFDTIDDFEDWVCDNADKREAYVWRHPTNSKLYLACGWCAC